VILILRFASLDSSSPPRLLSTINQVSDCSTDMGAVEIRGPPTALNKTYTVPEDSVLSGTAGANGLLLLCSSLLTASVADCQSCKPPAHGSLSLAANGSFTYTPARDFSGADSFEFLVSDIKGPLAVGKASITVGEWSWGYGRARGWEAHRNCLLSCGRRPCLLLDFPLWSLKPHNHRTQCRPSLWQSITNCGAFVQS
jgi:hypothetical protein